MYDFMQIQKTTFKISQSSSCGMHVVQKLWISASLSVALK